MLPHALHCFLLLNDELQEVLLFFRRTIADMSHFISADEPYP